MQHQRPNNYITPSNNSGYNKISDSGYTIIEVLIAIAIFSIGIMAMSALQSSSLMATGDITQKTEAWAVLEAHVERVRTNQYANIPANGSNEQSPNNRYTVSWQVAGGTPRPNCTTISVSVTLTGSNEVLAFAEFVKALAEDGV